MPTTTQSDGPVIQALTGELIDIRKRLRELSSEERALKESKTELEQRLIEAMDAIGTTGAKALGHTLNIQESVVPSWDDYDTFTNWLIESLPDHPENITLFERRISVPAYRELLKHGDVPGLKPFTKRSLSLRILS